MLIELPAGVVEGGAPTLAFTAWLEAGETFWFGQSDGLQSEEQIAVIRSLLATLQP